MTPSKTPESDTQSTRQDALRFLREATFNNLARANSPRVDAPDTPMTPKMIFSDLNDLDIKVYFFISQFSFMLITYKVVPDNPCPQPEAEESIRARHAILAVLPLPLGIPSDALRPISIPSAYTLQEFLACAAGVGFFHRGQISIHLAYRLSEWCMGDVVD